MKPHRSGSNSSTGSQSQETVSSLRAIFVFFFSLGALHLLDDIFICLYFYFFEEIFEKYEGWKIDFWIEIENCVGQFWFLSHYVGIPGSSISYMNDS